MAPKRHSRVRWSHLAIYGLLLTGVLVAGGIAVWSFVSRQGLAIQPEPLPKVTLVAANTRSPHAAAWVRLLQDAQIPVTLVPLDQLDPIEGVIVFCDVPTIPASIAQRLERFARGGGSIAFVGHPPNSEIAGLHLEAEAGTSDGAIDLADTVSPVLARVRPGQELLSQRVPVAVLKESPRMNVDARWKDNARAAAMHMEAGGRRTLWFGFRPDALVGNREPVHLLMRSAFRWIAGQPVSDGAIGTPQLAKTLSPDARLDARKARFAFSVDRQKANREIFTVRMANHGRESIANPTVKIWLPPEVQRVALAGDFLMRRNATLTRVPEDGSCLVSIPRLGRQRNRVIKLRIVAR